MKKLITITAIIILSITASSQTPAWQWIKSGGSGGVSTYGLKEGCKNICTDVHGNIYGISSVFDTYIVVDTIQKPQGFGYEDFCVFSYSCDGSFRWVRFFGSPYRDEPGGITVDNAGNVFVTGLVNVGTYGDAYFGDTIISQTTSMLKYAFVAKLDSSGHTEWVSLPGPASVVGMPIFLFVHIEKDNQGNPNVLVRFYGSCTYGSFSIPDSGLYLFKFDKTNGNLFDVTQLEIKQISGGNEGYFFTIDTDNSIYIMSDVADTVIVGNDTVATNYPASPAIYKTLLVKFSPTGNKIWHTVVSGTSGSTTDYWKMIWGKPLIFGNYVYIGGEIQSYPGANFFGVPINNPIVYSPNNKTTLITRFNKFNGNFVSVINLKNKRYIPPKLSLAKTDSSIIAASTGGQLIVMNQNDTINPVPSIFRNYPFVVEIDTALTHFNWGVATVGKGQPKIDAITVDNNGNIYVAGNMNDSIYNSYGVGVPNAAGNEDFFIAKVAVNNTNCGCNKPKPIALLVSFNNNILTVKGNATHNPDSLYWYWGDGDSTHYTAVNTNISHTYQSSGPYTVCLKAWNYCGYNDSCLLNLSSGITSLLNSEFSITYYPNPFKQTLTIELNQTIQNAEVYLFDLVGKKILNQKLNNSKTTINTSSLQNGIYILKVIKRSGGYACGESG